MSTNTAVNIRRTNLVSRAKKDIEKNKVLYIMLIPFTVWYLLFIYKPIGGLIAAFKDFNNPWLGISGSKWCGFDNFVTFFTSPFFFRTLKNTFIISFAGLIFGFPIPVIFALLLNEVENKKFKSLVQTVSILPHFISTVVICGMITSFLSPSTGVVNIVLDALGFERHYFLIDKKCFVPIYTIMGIWQSTGFSAIIYISALSSIDTELYEACKIDGGGKFRQTITVTIPGILPTIIIMLIMRIGNLLNVGQEAILLLYQPSTYETADVISTYVYRTGIVNGQYGISTAVGIFNSVVALVLVSLSNFVSKKTTEVALW